MPDIELCFGSVSIIIRILVPTFLHLYLDKGQIKFNKKSIIKVQYLLYIILLFKTKFKY